MIKIPRGDWEWIILERIWDESFEELLDKSLCANRAMSVSSDYPSVVFRRSGGFHDWVQVTRKQHQGSGNLTK